MQKKNNLFAFSATQRWIQHLNRSKSCLNNYCRIGKLQKLFRVAFCSCFFTALPRHLKVILTNRYTKDTFCLAFCEMVWMMTWMGPISRGCSRDWDRRRLIPEYCMKINEKFEKCLITTGCDTLGSKELRRHPQTPCLWKPPARAISRSYITALRGSGRYPNYGKNSVAKYRS
jgi:hypothetical protein